MNTTYEKFIDANNKLFNCFESVPQEKWTKMSSEEQSSLCHAEKEAVSQFLSTNKVGFANLLKERIEIISQPHHQ